MESSKRKKPQTENSCRSPASNLRSSSSLFRDISNFKTPKPPSKTLLSQFTTPNFTASKRTPSSTVSRRRPSMAPGTAASAKSKFSQRLKVLELEQSQSCRKELIKKEKSMKSLASSLTAWLNFLFENPSQCGCGGFEVRADVSVGSSVRKREEDDFRVDGLGRWPKRQRDGNWSDGSEISSSRFENLQKSLSELCSFDDLKGRMREFLSLSTCMEIFNVMTRVTKNIDEGRLTMKLHCPLVTDLGLKERAVKALLSYNAAWLRVGLYILFGGESLLVDGCSATDEEVGFLKLVMEKQLFSHVGLAKSFAYNKLVEGLYKPGYFEMLGNVILKRFLLLVLILDKAKTQSSLPIKYGLDGLDGGSPLLFNVQSNIKSSQQMITDFLIAEVMHGEGNLLAHLVMIGYKVSYEQLPLIEYDFRIGDLFEDIQDGVKLCRAIQLLQNDSSVLMKIVLPADSYKKRLANCNIALQYLKKAGVPLYDDDEMLITGEDIVNKDRELTLSLLWNVFVHLQIPLLITKTTLYDEIGKICKADSELKDLKSSSHLDMLLNWIKAICENYGDKKDTSNSVVDGKSMWCLLDFYFHTELTCACSPKDTGETSAEESVVSSVDRSDAVHNFVLSQKITTLLGNVPQVLQTSDILEYNGPCNNRSVIVLLVFMSTQLLVKKSKNQLNFHKLMGCRCQALERRRSSLDRLSEKTEEAKVIKDDSEETTADAARKFKAVKAWWQEMAKQNSDCNIKPAPPNPSHILNQKIENAASIVQRHCQGWLAKKHFETQRQAVSIIQRNFRGWIARRDASRRRHCIVVIQSNIRCWFARRAFLSQKSAAMVIQSSLRAVLCSKAFSAYRQAAIEIQRIIRGRITRARLPGATCIRDASQKNTAVANSESQFESTEHKIVMCAVVKLQRWWRWTKMLKSRMEAAVVIQSHFRGWVARRGVAREHHLIVLLQANWRGYTARRDAKEQQLIDLRRRVQESAANVDDGMRLINRHIAALNELLSMKSLSNILRNCATLDKATSLSSNCCEILVEAGAIDILLKMIKSVSRSIPDQEILKHALSILRNLARYPHLADSLISHRESVQTVLSQMLRNKEEAYFIACDLLKKVCTRREGVEAMHKLPALLKRLGVLVDELSRKASKEKRMTTRDGLERRLNEAVEILNMIRRNGRGDY